MSDLKRLDEKMRDRLEWSDVKMLRSILVFIDTQGWQATSSPTLESDEVLSDDHLDNIKSAIDYIVSVFREPLQAKNVLLSSLHDEIEEAVEYACSYLSVDKESYQRVWYKLNISPDSTKWSNVLSSYLAYHFPVGR